MPNAAVSFECGGALPAVSEVSCVAHWPQAEFF